MRWKRNKLRKFGKLVARERERRWKNFKGKRKNRYANVGCEGITHLHFACFPRTLFTSPKKREGENAFTVAPPNIKIK